MNQLRLFFLALLCFANIAANAQSQYSNKVVVVPLMGEESTWRGSWQIDTDYLKAEVVEEGGSSYIAVQTHTSSLANMPPDAEFWNLVAASGATGPQGEQGPKGDQGDKGDKGDQGVRGQIGDKGDTGDIGPKGDTGDQGIQGAPGSTGPAGAGLKFSMSINGTLSTDLQKPLYPIAHTGYSGEATFISAQGYQIGIGTDGDIEGSPSANYASGDCSGPVFIIASLIPVGTVAGFGNANALYYVPRTGATISTNPERKSRSTSSTVCEASVSALTGDYYEAPANNPAETGIDPLPRPANVLVNYVP